MSLIVDVVTIPQDNLPATEEGLADVEDTLAHIENGLERESFAVIGNIAANMATRGRVTSAEAGVEWGCESRRGGNSCKNEDKEGG